MPPKSFQLVTVDNYHEVIPKYIADNEVLISEYDDVTEMILKMISEGYCFSMDKNLLRGYCEDFAYMFNPSDTVNRDRIVNMLEESDDEDEDEDEEEGGMDNMMMNMLMNMAKGGGGGGLESMLGGDDEEEEKKDEKVEEVKECEPSAEASAEP